MGSVSTSNRSLEIKVDHFYIGYNDQLKFLLCDHEKYLPPTQSVQGVGSLSVSHKSTMPVSGMSLL